MRVPAQDVLVVVLIVALLHHLLHVALDLLGRGLALGRIVSPGGHLVGQGRAYLDNVGDILHG